MNRIDKSLYLLYIEPPKEERLQYPIDDMLTQVMEISLQLAISGVGKYNDLNCNGRFYFDSGYMGFHETNCGERSDNHDYLLKSGHITNSLAAFYLRWYRNSIPQTEYPKLADVLYYHIRNLNYDRDKIYEVIKKLRSEDSDLWVQDIY